MCENTGALNFSAARHADSAREAQANAYLVAAAPKLYEALRHARLLVLVDHPEHAPDSAAARTLRIIDAALAQAEGR